MLRRLLCVLAGAGAIGVAAPAMAGPGEVPTAADFSAPPTLSNPAMSPDGRHVAALAFVGDLPKLRIFDVAGPAIAVRQIDLAQDQDVDWLNWAGNGRIVAGVHAVEGPGQDAAGRTRLVSIEADTGRQTPIGREIEGEPQGVIHMDPAGRFLLLGVREGRERFPSVYRVDLATGAAARVVKPRQGVRNWYADPAGVVRAGMGEHRGKWWLIYRAHDGESFRPTIRKSGPASNDLEQFAPVQGSDQGYALAPDARGGLALYQYDFSDDRLGKAVYENPSADVDSFRTGADGKVEAVYYTTDRPRVAWLDPALGALQARVDAALPGRINRIESVSDDRGRLLVWSGAATDPGSYWLYDRASDGVKLVAEPNDALAGKQLSPMAAVEYRARDGLGIPAYLTLPAGRGDKGLPLVVLPHGGPFERDTWGYDPWVQFLASKGYAVLQPNYRGSTGFGEDYIERGTGQWGRGMQDDLDDGVKWLAAQGIVDPRRVCIMGASYGGYAAMWAAVRNPDLYRCAISFAGISDVDAMLRFDRHTFPTRGQARSWRARIEGDPGFSLDSISPLKLADRLTVPILIAHGTADDNVPVAQSRALDEALTRLGRAHDYVEYPGEGHGLDLPEDSTDFLTRVGAFLEKHNPS